MWAVGLTYEMQLKKLNQIIKIHLLYKTPQRNEIKSDYCFGPGLYWLFNDKI